MTYESNGSVSLSGCASTRMSGQCGVYYRVKVVWVNGRHDLKRSPESRWAMEV